MTETTSYNDHFRSMDWDYLRSRQLSPFIQSPIVVTIPPENLPDPGALSLTCDCCDVDRVFLFPALADIADGDPFKNDYCPVLYQSPITPDSVNYFLQKYQGGSFVNVQLLNSTYGTTYAPGIFTDYPEYFGYQLQWRQVLINHGVGTYRIKTSITILSSTTDFYYFPFCLKEYSVAAADKTVKFEWYNNGIIMYADDDFTELNFGNINWKQMVRLKGAFGYQTEEQEVVDASYFSGHSLKTDRIHDKTNYKYKFKSGYYPHTVHSILKNLAFKSNNIYVTTYGKLDKRPYISKAVLKESNGYSPDYGKVYKKDYNVEVDFRDKYEDLGARKNCAPSGNNPQGVTIKDEDGNILSIQPDGSIYVVPSSTGCDPATIKNSDNSYSESIPSGNTETLPDTTYKFYLDGVLFSSETVPTLKPGTTINLTL